MSQKTGSAVISAVKGVFISVIATLLGILLFALFIKLFSLPSAVVKPVNQVIKVVSVFLGCFIPLKGKMGYLKGVIVGLLSTVITYLIFALVSGEALFNSSFLIDLLFGAIVGAISGVLAVNVKKQP